MEPTRVGRFEVPERLLPFHGFAFRVYARMMHADGIDRAIAIGALAFTALFPMLIVYASLITRGDGFDLGNRLIDRFDLSGSTADTVESAFQAPAGSSTAVIGAVLVVLTALSFTRAVQRLYESVWGLERRGFRASGWGLLWLLELIVWLGLQPALDSNLGPGLHAAASLTIAAALWLSTPYLLLGRRIDYRTLTPGALLTATAMTLAGYASAVLMPSIVASSSQEFGTIGVAFALLTWLTALAFVIMGCTVLSAEVARGGWRGERE